MKNIIAAFIMLLTMAAGTLAYVPDGNPADWGIDLAGNLDTFSSWQPDSDAVDYVVENDIDPRLNTQEWNLKKLKCDWTCYTPGWTQYCYCQHGVHKTVFDAHVTTFVEAFKYYSPFKQQVVQPTSGELFDQSAIYCDNDPNKLFFMMVTSTPPAGAVDVAGTLYKPGDLGLDFNGDGKDEYGIKLTGANKGQICFLPTWIEVDEVMGNWVAPGVPGYWSFTCPQGHVVGQATVAYVKQAQKDNGKDLYVVEVSAPRTAFDVLDDGDVYYVYNQQECGNDEIEANCKINEGSEVPEFNALEVIGMLGLIGVAVAFIRKR
ncbi:MAG: hypothetical protein HGA85_07015 [Nanoarchaeota archaeon]|nr:hypothetical protein [Nanoarchaeota archaeon]